MYRDLIILNKICKEFVYVEMYIFLSLMDYFYVYVDYEIDDVFLLLFLLMGGVCCFYC